MGDITKEYSPLQQQWRVLLCLANAAWKRQRSGSTLLLENRTILVLSFATFRRLCSCFLAAKDDFLKQEDMIFPVDIGLRHDKNVVEEEITEIFKMMAFPILYPRLQ